MSALPLIVGYGGISAAGRSIFDLAFKRMLFEELNSHDQNEVITSLGHLMNSSDREQILSKSLMRAIDKDFFLIHQVHLRLE